MLRFAFIILIALPGIMGCASGRELQPMIEITLDRPEGNSAEVTIAGGRALIDVRDERGINGLNARLTAGEWPEEVVVRLSVSGLERLEIHYGNITIATGRSSNESPDPPLMLSVVDEQGQLQSASPSSDVYYPDIDKTDEGFEITLPPHFYHEDPPSFSLQWIDFFRQ